MFRPRTDESMTCTVNNLLKNTVDISLLYNIIFLIIHKLAKIRLLYISLILKSGHSKYNVQVRA